MTSSLHSKYDNNDITLNQTVGADDHSGDDHHDEHDGEEDFVRKFLSLRLQTQHRRRTRRLVVSLAVVFRRVGLVVRPPAWHGLPVTEHTVGSDGSTQGDGQHGGQGRGHEPHCVDDHAKLPWNYNLLRMC